MLREAQSGSSHGIYIMRAVKCLRQMPYKRRLVELISALEELMTRVEVLAGQQAREGLVFGQTELHAEVVQSTEQVGFEPRLFDDSALLHEGLGYVEQSLPSLELVPDVAWPFMDWNLNLLSLDTDFLSSCTEGRFG
jgi:hypothetical protein